MITRDTSDVWREIRCPATLRGRGAVEDGTILRVVGEMTGEEVGDPEPDRRVQHAEHGDRRRVSRETMHERSVQCCSVIRRRAR